METPKSQSKLDELRKFSEQGAKNYNEQLDRAGYYVDETGVLKKRRPDSYIDEAIAFPDEKQIVPFYRDRFESAMEKAKR